MPVTESYLSQDEKNQTQEIVLLPPPLPFVELKIQICPVWNQHRNPRLA